MNVERGNEIRWCEEPEIVLLVIIITIRSNRMCVVWVYCWILIFFVLYSPDCALFRIAWVYCIASLLAVSLCRFECLMIVCV
jgi:hypothetical protein